MAKLLSMPAPTQASRPQSEDEFIGGAGIVPSPQVDEISPAAPETIESTATKVDVRAAGRSAKSTDKARKMSAPVLEEDKDKDELVSMTFRLPRRMINALVERARIDERSASQVLRRLLKPLDI
jgi:hypothetical protein